MLRDEETKIVSHVDAGSGYRFLVLDAPKLAADLVPGQFVHVRIPGLEASALRRPFSVFDAADGRVTVMYKIVGRGTEALPVQAQIHGTELQDRLFACEEADHPNGGHRL